MRVGEIMNKKGFTLTELITVIAIIGLILLITIPVYTGVMNNNKEEKYKLYVETVEKAVLTYADIELSSTVETSVSLAVLKEYGYLKDSSDVKANTIDKTNEIKIKKENNKVTINGGDELELTFEDGTTCDKTKCR